MKITPKPENSEMNRMLDKDQQYITSILKGLPSTMDDSNSLHSIVASAWGNNHNLTFTKGRLQYDISSLLPNHSKTNNFGDYSHELSSIEKICQHNWAKKYSCFFLAQAWGARFKAPQASSNDVSVFDYNRIETAKFSCSQHEGYNDKMLLVKGGVSGIQNFIYHNIQAEQIGDAVNVGKKLRGRSFFVTILGDILAEHIIERLELEQANILFVGGGHFNLLLPKTDTIISQLTAIHEDFNRSFLDDFGASLSVMMAHEVVDEKENDYTKIFQTVTDKLESQKQKKYFHQLSEIFPHTFPYDAGRTVLENSMIDLGQSVPKASFLVEIRGESEARSQFRNAVFERDNGEDRKFFTFAATQADYYLHKVKEHDEKKKEHLLWEDLLNMLTNGTQAANSDHLRVKIIRLNHTQFLPPASLHADFQKLPVGYGFRFLGQHTPVCKVNPELEENSPERIKMFEELAVPTQKGESYQQLAALRLDVDDLGALFALGLGKAHNLDRISSLSREIQYFFAGYINILAKEHDIYVVYSGGDDAFLIGSWYNILLFAQKLRQQFSVLSANNPHIGFSAGIFTCHPSYPLALLGYKAGEQEHKAKNYRQQKELIKNAVCVFDHTVSWSRFDEMMSFYQQMFQFVERPDTQKSGSSSQQGSIKRSVLQHLLKVIQASMVSSESGFYCGEDSKNTTSSDDHFEFYRNIGRLHALLSRRGYFDEDKKGENSKLSGLIKTLLSDMSDFEKFADYLIPFNILLYKTRG